MALPRLRASHARLLLVLLVSTGALALLVRWVWPSPWNPGLRASFETLRASPVPVLVYVPRQPRDTHAEVTADGYRYTVAAESNLVVSGRRAQPGARFDGYYRRPGQITWTDGGVEYSVEVGSAEAWTDEIVHDSLLSLDAARLDQWGFSVDTPVLFLFYVPAFAAFTAWAAWLALAGRVFAAAGGRPGGARALD